MNKMSDDTLLARWLNNDLSEKEKIAFERSKDYHIYKKIVMGVDQFQSPDVNIESLLQNIKSVQRTTIKPVKPNRRAWMYGLAASIALLITLSLFGIRYFRTTTVMTGYGEQKEIVLPDGSQVKLNARSELSYHKWNWADDRSLSLTGEAYFKVTKGNNFTVETKNGSVAVLGTQFNVQSINDFFEVICFEGRVRVNAGENETELTPGKGFRQIQEQMDPLSVAASSPEWTQNQSSFKEVPLKYVLLALENQFEVHFTGYLPPLNQTFTGSFPHSDRDVALRIVLGALQINYQVQQNTIVLEEK